MQVAVLLLPWAPGDIAVMVFNVAYSFNPPFRRHEFVGYSKARVLFDEDKKKGESQEPDIQGVSITCAPNLHLLHLRERKNHKTTLYAHLDKLGSSILNKRWLLSPEVMAEEVVVLYFYSFIHSLVHTSCCSRTFSGDFVVQMTRSILLSWPSPFPALHAMALNVV